MKILHLSTFAHQGGAARAAFTIHRSLRDHGVDSQMVVQQSRDSHPFVDVPQTVLRKALDRLRCRLERSVLRMQNTENPIFHSMNVLPSFRLGKINRSDCDVVHLHWVNKSMLSIAEIGQIEKPVVWTLHDAWPFCGAEHHSRITGRDRYREGYRPDNRDPDHRGVDLDRLVWHHKMKHWKEKSFSLVAPSRWMAGMARESVLFREETVHTIHHPIDLRAYKPIDKTTARRILDLPEDTKLLLIGALNPSANPLKGYEKLKGALDQFSYSEAVGLIQIGGSWRGQGDEFSIPTYRLGRLYDDWSLALAYSAADAIVVPSMIESFGLLAAESASCGTPCVAFDATGTQDVVEHRRSGYLAEPYRPRSLADGIHWVLDQPEEEIRRSTHDVARSKFRPSKVSSEYVDIYRHAIK